MGYCIWTEDGSINIKKENMVLALKKLSRFFKGNKFAWCESYDIENLRNIDNMELTSEVISEIWRDLRYSCEETETHYLINEFLGEKLGDDVSLFKVIAEYCDDNSYLQFVGEDGRHFRIIIKDREAIEKWGKLSWN